MRRKGGRFNSSTLRVHKLLVIVFLSVFVLLLVGFIIGYHGVISSLFSKKQVQNLTCGDGTSYDFCSLRKPYLCRNGFLVEQANVCGCPTGFFERDDLCESPLQTGPRLANLSYVFFGERNFISFRTYDGVANYLGSISRSITYQKGELPFRVDFKLKYVNEVNQNYFLLPLVSEIQNRAKSRDDQARIAVSLVQNIPFNKSEKKTYVGNGVSIDYFRYPYEVLYDGFGVCGEKSALLAYLLRELGYGVILFYFEGQNHEAIGIKCPTKYSYKNTGYCFVETSGPSIISDYGLEYFGGVGLDNSPEIMLISEGVSLGADMDEYSDAIVLSKAREGKINLNEIRKIIDKYGLAEVYYLD